MASDDYDYFEDQKVCITLREYEEALKGNFHSGFWIGAGVVSMIWVIVKLSGLG